MTILTEEENLFDFVDNNIVQFMLETVYIGERQEKYMVGKSFKMTVVLGNGLFIVLFMIISSFFANKDKGKDKDEDRIIAHTCPNLQSEVKLVNKITTDVKNLQRSLKQMVFDQKNGH